MRAHKFPGMFGRSIADYYCLGYALCHCICGPWLGRLTLGNLLWYCDSLAVQLREDAIVAGGLAVSVNDPTRITVRLHAAPCTNVGMEVLPGSVNNHIAQIAVFHSSLGQVLVIGHDDPIRMRVVKPDGVISLGEVSGCILRGRPFRVIKMAMQKLA